MASIYPALPPNKSSCCPAPGTILVARSYVGKTNGGKLAHPSDWPSIVLNDFGRYQASFVFERVVGRCGLEPHTSALSARRSTS